MTLQCCHYICVLIITLSFALQLIFNTFEAYLAIKLFLKMYPIFLLICLYFVKIINNQLYEKSSVDSIIATGLYELICHTEKQASHLYNVQVFALLNASEGDMRVRVCVLGAADE